jgi:hypothetical protein
MAGTPSTGTSTNTFAVDNTQRYQVIAQTRCSRVLVQENYNSATPPTADLLMSAPAGSTQIAVAKGTPAIFTPTVDSLARPVMFAPGEVVGDIETVSGSITVQQIESTQV